MSLFYDSNIKPKLIEPKLIKKIVLNQKQNQKQIDNISIDLDMKITDNIIIFFKNNYLIIIVLLAIFLGLYWRYHEIRKKRFGDEISEEYEEDSEISTTED